MTTIGNQSRPAYVYDSETDTWVPIGVGPHTHNEYIDKAVIDAKGNILVGTAPDTAGILSAGLDGQYLVADSSAPTGLAWVDVDALPDQTGEAGKYLTTDGSTASWATVEGGGGDPTPQIFLMMGA